MNINDAFEYIEDCAKYGSVPGLESITALCDRLGNPQNNLKFIHVAGTNGKGSTLCFVSTIMSHAGLKVGRYVSPTIVSYLERFQVNGVLMSKKAFASYVTRVASAIDDMIKEGLPHPTAFEIETAISFLFFVDKKCDIVLLECGMGGAYDATNLVKTSIIEVFAHIDMDHMQFLGESLEEIATQKAGIIKESTAVVSGVQHLQVSKILENASMENNASFDCVQESLIDKIKYGANYQEFEYKKEKYRTTLRGTYQIYNAACAIEVIACYNRLVVLNNDGINVNLDKWWCNKKVISDAQIKWGLLHASWPGRMQIVSKTPLIIADGAHNPDAAARLKETIDIYYKNKRKIIIIGMFKDKEIDKVIKLLCEDADMVLTVATPGNPRALPSVELAREVMRVNKNVTSTDSVEEAVWMAKMMADKDTLILACGSLAYLGRLMDAAKIQKGAKH